MKSETDLPFSFVANSKGGFQGTYKIKSISPLDRGPLAANPSLLLSDRISTRGSFFFIASPKPIPPVRPTARKVCLQPSLEPPAISPSPFFSLFFFPLFCFLRSVVAFFLLFHPSLAVFGESGADLFKRRCYRRDSRGNGEREKRREEKRKREKGRSLGRKYGDEFGLMLLEVA